MPREVRRNPDREEIATGLVVGGLVVGVGGLIWFLSRDGSGDPNSIPTPSPDPGAPDPGGGTPPATPSISALDARYKLISGAAGASQLSISALDARYLIIFQSNATSPSSKVTGLEVGYSVG